ncbi:hypothetical protein GCM10010420_35660 [Streptomyces glaucosporus]|uniref:Secreted protein n=1 Tax=Streptomyces glaucosporus TaxID=284044 RepID=A0ABP5VKW3_9ACTN
MTVSRRDILRSASAVVPAMVIGGALPGTASAAARAAQWQVFPVTPGWGWYSFNRISLAGDGTAKALGAHHSMPDGVWGPVQTDPLVWSFDGTQWTVSGLADGTRPLNGVTATTAADAWAVGERWDKAQMLDVPQLLRWDGTAWTNRTTGADALSRPRQVSGTGSNVWVVGTAKHPATGPAVVRLNGSGWAPVGLPATLGADTELLTVQVVAADDVWVAGRTGTGTSRRSLVMRWNGSSWTVLPAPFGTAVGHVTSLLVRGGECWAGGGAGNRAAVAVWNGRAWAARNPLSSGTSEVGQLAAHGSVEVWAAGAGMTLQRWNGTSWSEAEGPLPAPLNVGALATGPDGALWMAGVRDSSDATRHFFAKLPVAP